MVSGYSRGGKHSSGASRPPPPSITTNKHAQTATTSASPRYFYDSPPSQPMVPPPSARYPPTTTYSSPSAPYPVSGAGAGGYYPAPQQAPSASPPSYDAPSRAMAPRGAQAATPASPYMTAAYGAVPTAAYNYATQPPAPSSYYYAPAPQVQPYGTYPYPMTATTAARGAMPYSPQMVPMPVQPNAGYVYDSRTTAGWSTGEGAAYATAAPRGGQYYYPNSKSSSSHHYHHHDYNNRHNQSAGNNNSDGDALTIGDSMSSLSLGDDERDQDIPESSPKVRTTRKDKSGDRSVEEEASPTTSSATKDSSVQAHDQDTDGGRGGEDDDGGKDEENEREGTKEDEEEDEEEKNGEEERNESHQAAAATSTPSKSSDGGEPKRSPKGDDNNNKEAQYMTIGSSARFYDRRRSNDNTGYQPQATTSHYHPQQHQYMMPHATTSPYTMSTRGARMPQQQMMVMDPNAQTTTTTYPTGTTPEYSYPAYYPPMASPNPNGYYMMQQPQRISMVPASHYRYLEDNTPLYVPTNPQLFPCNPYATRFFVIKSFRELHVFRSIRDGVWASTEEGNRKLDKAYMEATQNGGHVYLFFSVNGSRQFCGMAMMTSRVDFSKDSRQTWGEWVKYKGIFHVKWKLAKDVPNPLLYHIKLPNNELKPVSSSKDAQEVPYLQGVETIQALCAYQASTSIRQDFPYYESFTNGSTAPDSNRHEYASSNYLASQQAARAPPMQYSQTQQMPGYAYHYHRPPTQQPMMVAPPPPPSSLPPPPAPYHHHARGTMTTQVPMMQSSPRGITSSTYDHTNGMKGRGTRGGKRKSHLGGRGGGGGGGRVSHSSPTYHYQQEPSSPSHYAPVEKDDKEHESKQGKDIQEEEIRPVGVDVDEVATPDGATHKEEEAQEEEAKEEAVVAS